MRSSILVVVAATALLATACGAETDGPTAETPETTPAATPESPAVSLANRCTDTEIGYEMRYPDGWETNPGDVLPACRIFDPETIALEEGTEIPFDLAITVRAEDIAYEEMVDLIGDDPGLEVRSTEETQVDGRDALRVEAEGTGEALLPEGMARYGYYVDLDGRTLLATTYDAGEPDFETKTDVLDAMMDELQWDGRSGY